MNNEISNYSSTGSTQKVPKNSQNSESTAAMTTKLSKVIPQEG